jgi:hypothetical protein
MALWSVGETLTAAKMNLTAPGYEYRKVKTADQTVAASTTFVNDNDLFFPVPSGASYWSFQIMMRVNDGAGDIKFQMTVPTGYEIHWSPLFYGDTGGTFGSKWLALPTGQTSLQNLLSASQSFSSDASVSDMGIMAWGIVFDSAGSGSAGNIQLQWAQNGASGSTLVQKGSNLIAWRFNQ